MTRHGLFAQVGQTLVAALGGGCLQAVGLGLAQLAGIGQRVDIAEGVGRAGAHRLGCFGDQL